jgi:hypothetical protein
MLHRWWKNKLKGQLSQDRLGQGPNPFVCLFWTKIRRNVFRRNVFRRNVFRRNNFVPTFRPSDSQKVCFHLITNTESQYFQIGNRLNKNKNHCGWCCQEEDQFVYSCLPFVRSVSKVLRLFIVFFQVFCLFILFLRLYVCLLCFSGLPFVHSVFQVLRLWKVFRFFKKRKKRHLVTRNKKKKF